jgi:hypothetical protein
MSHDPKPPALTHEQIEILFHTRDRAAGGFFCGGSPAMDGLVEQGLMEFAGKKAYVPDSYYRMTPKGRELLRLTRIISKR